MLQNLSVQFSSITRGVFFVRLQTETCSVVLGIFRECGTVFYRVRYGTVRCIHLVIPLFTLAQEYGPRQANLCLRAFLVMENFNCSCPVIQRGQGSGFLSEGSS